MDVMSYEVHTNILPLSTQKNAVYSNKQSVVVFRNTPNISEWR
jgi:hypothetical protein